MDMPFFFIGAWERFARKIVERSVVCPTSIYAISVNNSMGHSVCCVGNIRVVERHVDCRMSMIADKLGFP